MKDTIDQFMWGFQQHFRLGVERGIEQALAEIGLGVKARVVLVGLASEESVEHQLCVEPEDGPLSAEHLSTVSDRAAELFHADPDSRLHHTNSRHHELQQHAIFLRSRAEALVEVIEASGGFEGLTFFGSDSAPIGGYVVHTCVGIPTQAFASIPALDDDRIDRIYVGRSLQHEVIAECLRRADRALYLPDPGAGLHTLGATDAIIKASAEYFVDGLVCRTVGQPADLFSRMNRVTSLSYERAGAEGRLLIAGSDSTADSVRVRFHRPVALHNERIVRKLLELSDDATAVLADHSRAYGLGTCTSTSPDAVEVLVRGHADWELRFGGLALVRVSYGRARLPVPLLDRGKFEDIAMRTVGSADLDRIWAVVEAAQAARRGMTLVVSDAPEAEASRLGGQAVPIEPLALDPADIVRLGRVDGAVVLDPDGHCHAFGVILDGEAVAGKGDPSRGSRFNSAVRYQRTRAPKSLLVVISDDGLVDLIPNLMPKVHRHEVESAVSAFCLCCETEPVDGEEFGRTHRRVEELRFYLNADQCERVNACYEGEMRRRYEGGGLALSGPPLRSHPDMDESYFY